MRRGCGLPEPFGFNWAHSRQQGVVARSELLAADVAQRIRYNFGTTEGEISGERIRKRRSAKHLEVLFSLLEGRRSIQLSYGRLTDSKRFAAPKTIICYV